MEKIINRFELVQELNSKFGSCAEIFEDNTERSIIVKSDKITSILEYLKNSESYRLNMLMNLSSVDYKDKLTVIYHLNSLEYLHKLTVKVELDRDNPVVPSVASIFRSADVQEREVYDLMGIVFLGHPNLKRILLTDDFIGYPLRKDFNF